MPLLITSGKLDALAKLRDTSVRPTPRSVLGSTAVPAASQPGELAPPPSEAAVSLAVGEGIFCDDEDETLAHTRSARVRWVRDSHHDFGYAASSRGRGRLLAAPPQPYRTRLVT